MSAAVKKLSVFVSEDDSDDQFLFRSALLECAPEAEILFVSTGQELVTALLKTAVYSESKMKRTPDLILADLREPFFEIAHIRELRIYSQFRHIPFYVFSISAEREIAAAAIGAGASGFYLKPSTFSELKSLVRKIIKNLPA